jgi:hypothetical protein
VQATVQNGHPGRVTQPAGSQEVKKIVDASHVLLQAEPLVCGSIGPMLTG